MTASRAPAEPTVREFETTVDAVDGREVVLAETYFYPESGGQPADRGTLCGIELTDVFERDGEVVHVLAADPDADQTRPAVGETVTGVIDDDFRTYCTRAHTASHVLYGAARRLFSTLGYAGFDISPEKVRVDLQTDEPLRDADLVELERLANRAVWESRDVSWETHTPADARALDDIAFNTKTEEGAMREDTVRVVTIDGWDVAACGGTHVETTATIGPITALGRSNPGEGVTRVEFAVGPTAIDRAATIHDAARAAAASADSSLAALPDAVARLREETDRLETALAAARDDLLSAQLDSFPVVDREGTPWAIGTVTESDPNNLRDPATTLVETADGPAVVAVVGAEAGSPPFLVVATDSASGVDAGAVVAAATNAFGGGGGGGPTFAQGGGLDADVTAVVEWLRDPARP